MSEDLKPLPLQHVLERLYAADNKYRDLYRSRATLRQSYMIQAQVFADLRSKDPNSRMGAVLVHRISGASLFGYNGFPASLPDRIEVWECRDAAQPLNKYRFVRHAEANVMRKAAQHGMDLRQCELLVTAFPCERCCIDFILDSGIPQLTVGCPYAGSDETLRMLRNATVAVCGFDYAWSELLHFTSWSHYVELWRETKRLFEERLFCEK